MHDTDQPSSVTGPNRSAKKVRIPMKALILDSNAEDCADVIEHLRRVGYTSITVASVAQAREALEHQAFDVLLLEWALPDGDGAQLCNEIRDRLGQGMLIMFVSSRD